MTRLVTARMLFEAEFRESTTLRAATHHLQQTRRRNSTTEKVRFRKRQKKTEEPQTKPVLATLSVAAGRRPGAVVHSKNETTRVASPAESVQRSPWRVSAPR
jgi:hypothetical protein